MNVKVTFEGPDPKHSLMCGKSAGQSMVISGACVSRTVMVWVCVWLLPAQSTVVHVRSNM